MPYLRPEGLEQHLDTHHCEGGRRGACETATKFCRNRGVVLGHCVGSRWTPSQANVEGLGESGERGMYRCLAGTWRLELKD